MRTPLVKVVAQVVPGAAAVEVHRHLAAASYPTELGSEDAEDAMVAVGGRMRLANTFEGEMRGTR